MADKYNSFEELKNNEVLGLDYEIICGQAESPILVLAPHGGMIEPGTTELAVAIAGRTWGYYSFCGLKDNAYQDLHITSTKFDEPIALKLVTNSKRTIAIHGCKDMIRKKIYIGGLDSELKQLIGTTLTSAGFDVSENPKFPGVSRANICNKNYQGKGVQLELTGGLRLMLFPDFPLRNRTTHCFETFVAAVQSVLHSCNTR
ncbi:poly-gamma-glutamate hydrolase family protein [Desulfotruncus alcoholivorax]|uniref:poly-gamma-glutamate hydrolase family protein n=1 Tax=Desulfotruncus alcoholivorax TaxID=265477 RepID=UPI000418136D|nr:poly-gamma-glutamate hydrolase family protein [Desulfotruncus alcoholivorax]